MSNKSNNQDDWGIANQRYLADMVNIIKDHLKAHSKPLNEEEKESVSKKFLLSMQELKESLNNIATVPPIELLTNIMGLSSFEKNILLLCAGAELDAEIAELITFLQDEKLFALPTFSLVLAIFPESHWSAITLSGPLRYWRLIEVNKTPLVTRSPLKIDEHILHFLAGVTEQHEKLREMSYSITRTGHLLPSQFRVVENVCKILSERKTGALHPLIHLMGKDQSGKLTIAMSVNSWLGSELYIISAPTVPSNTHEITEMARLWSREAALNGYILFLDCTEIDLTDKVKTESIIRFIENLHGVVILSSSEWAPEFRRSNFVFYVEKPVPNEQLSLWQNICVDAGYNASELGLDKLVSQFNLSTSTIAKIANEIFTDNSDGEKNGMEHDYLSKKLWKICCEHTRPLIDELAQRIEPLAEWDDIIIPEEQKSILRTVAAQVRNRNKVYEQWGFSKKMSRGLGISVLFAGESGTGKTMAAEVLANDLQLELYKIDLSKVVNKYIGETEKNLKKIFDAAEDGGTILLFDEADALFGKRSEVKDSHDRYSNIEVSYLLQRMEAYRGLAILTTNMKNALDKAFLRRIRFIVTFPFPDATHRSQIWKKVFPAGAKHNLDIERLARLNVAGGSIKNIALNAAFFAADEGDEVFMSHISRAAKAEYEKLEKPLTNFYA
jgi:ATP-dependent 26S proteasome regulatory subunit